MSTPSLVRAFQEAYESTFDEPYQGPEDDLNTALQLVEEEAEPEDWDETILREAFEQANITEADDWPSGFWTDLLDALLQA